MAVKHFIEMYWKTAMFNIGLLAAVFLTGFFILNRSWEMPLFVMLAFAISRMLIGNAKHYKKIYVCAVWSYVVYMSLFLLGNVGIPLALSGAIFTALILSDHSKLGDVTQFAGRGKPSNFRREIEFVRKNHTDVKLVDIELWCAAEGDHLDVVYDYVFKRGITWEATKLETGLDERRLNLNVEVIGRMIRRDFNLR